MDGLLEERAMLACMVEFLHLSPLKVLRVRGELHHISPMSLNIMGDGFTSDGLLCHLPFNLK